LGALGVVGVELVVLRVHARARRVEHAAHPALPGLLDHVEVDRGRVVHDVGVVVAGEDVAGPAHVGGELVHLVDGGAAGDAVEEGGTDAGVAEVAEDEVVGGVVAELVALEVDAADPVALGLEAVDEVAADEASGAADDGGSHSLSRSWGMACPRGVSHTRGSEPTIAGGGLQPPRARPARKRRTGSPRFTVSTTYVPTNV